MLSSNEGFQPAVQFYLGNIGSTPVSPMSNESIGGIKFGATSLSSNTSDDQKPLPLPGLAVIKERPSEELNNSRFESDLPKTDLVEF